MLSRVLLAAMAGLTLMALGACVSEPSHRIPHPTAPSPSRVIPPPPPIDVLRPR
ncbi:hypothetical protein [Phenylobacterium aquaticum]|uniref:hypothetical protein n=1 Tax=Phenylobacterium aquaticum TaxID=1763816 RepID=UPI0026EC399D|nr:hypothetical protein [Phenylobacterium aquaticum]